VTFINFFPLSLNFLVFANFYFYFLFVSISLCHFHADFVDLTTICMQQFIVDGQLSVEVECQSKLTMLPWAVGGRGRDRGPSPSDVIKL